MSDEAAYQLKSTGTFILRERGSRFLAFAIPITGEEDAAEKLRSLKEEHPQANHICYAWVLKEPRLLYRLSDDGEPSGSAGLPIYHQLLSQQLMYSLLAVVRYFGGKKLGIPGLIAAYGEAAKKAILDAAIEAYAPVHTYRLQYDPVKHYRFFEFCSKYACEILENDLEKGEATISCEGQLLPEKSNIPVHFAIFEIVHLKST